MVLVVKNSPASAGDVRDADSIPEMERRRKWQLIPVLLPGESHGQRSLVGYSSWGLKELDTTESDFAQQIIPSNQWAFTKCQLLC